MFLVNDAVAYARRGQKAPDGYHNIQSVLKCFASASHKILLCRTCMILLCRTCMDARGHAEADLTDRAQRCTIDEPAAELIDPDKVIVF